MSERWTPEERRAALDRAAREGVDLVVVGGGITGAGVLRDAASRGLRALLVERGDFASGTSSRSSKMIHGGLRYLAEGAFRLTREACRERDLLQRQCPELVRPLPFLVPAWEESRTPLWKLRAAMLVYRALAGWRGERTRVMSAAEALGRAPGLREAGLRGAACYVDAEVDDARLVLETLKSARRLGGEAASHAELTGFLRRRDGGLAGVQLRDHVDGRELEVRSAAVVNAAGPSADRVRALDRPVGGPPLRPAKGVHLVVSHRRLPLDLAVIFDAPDGRPVFATPWEGVTLVGTTDEFSDEIDEPVVRIDEVHYLLGAVNGAFPRAGLTTNDLRSVFAGVRPLAGDGGAAEASNVSREDRVVEDPSGLVSVSGGKLTTHRAMAERVLRQVLRRLPADVAARVGPSTTRSQPLRQRLEEPGTLAAGLAARHGVEPAHAGALVHRWGAEAEDLLAGADADGRRPVGDSPFLWAEIAWSLERECAVDLCDLLERRLRLAILSDGQGLLQLDAIAAEAARAAGWDAERREREAAAYTDTVRRRYQIAAPPRRRAA